MVMQIILIIIVTIIGILFKGNILHLFGATPGNYKYSKIPLIFSLFCSIIFIANLPE